MSDSEEVIPEKKGRGRPPAEKVDKVVKDFRFKWIFNVDFLPYSNRSVKLNQKRKVNHRRPRRGEEGPKAPLRRILLRKLSRSQKLHASLRKNPALKKKSLKDLRLKKLLSIMGI